MTSATLSSASLPAILLCPPLRQPTLAATPARPATACPPMRRAVLPQPPYGGGGGATLLPPTATQHRGSAAHRCTSIRPTHELSAILSQPSRSVPIQQQQQQQQPSQHQQQQQQQQPQQPQLVLSRREAVVLPLAGSMLLQLVCDAQPAAASKLGAGADAVWESLGGGPADLTFPDSWAGVWDVASTLVSVEVPLGEDVLPPANKAAVQRAQAEDLNRTLRYQVALMRNTSGRVVFDRRFNTAALLAQYYGSNVDFAGRISWDPQDPNVLGLSLPDGIQVTTRVLRRSEQAPAHDRIETSEFMQQVFDDGRVGQPRVKASQCFTKYRFRDEAAAAAAGGPAIVATQVVNDFLTPNIDSGDDSLAYLAAANKPIATFTYRMVFMRHQELTQQVASALHTS